VKILPSLQNNGMIKIEATKMLPAITARIAELELSYIGNWYSLYPVGQK
jgi:hypothetical protein